MEKNINRRHALTGAVALAAAALPVIAKAAPPHADAALFAVLAKWEAGKALEISFGADHTAMERNAAANSPPDPAALTQPMERHGETDQCRFAIGWSMQELTFYSPPNVEELKALRLEHDAAREMAWTEARAGEERFNEIVSANTDLINEIGETPAQTVEGLLAKCNVAQVEGLFVNFMDFSDFAQGLVEDIQRIAPQIAVRP